MSADLQARIAELDGKQAIHCMTLIGSGAPPNAVASAHAEVGPIPPGLDAATLEGPEAHNIARTFLAEFAQDGGEEVVRAALDQPPSQSADFGLVTGPLLLTFIWLAITGDIDIKIGGVTYRKAGLPADKQIELGKKLLPKLLEHFSLG